ncbi:MAG TPA: zinc-binding alcohol dehydrogenase [bacterium]|nr:zinc-binding alcohol dehydrogenase [bacterium]
MKVRRILFESIEHVVMEETEIGPIASGHVRVKNLFSLISTGTELLQLRGAMGPFQHSEVGYCAVGRIVEGEGDTGFQKGDYVHTHGHHNEIIDVPTEKARKTFIPVDPELAEQATFLPLGKVAMHGLHRVHISMGDWIVVFGLGIVGNLTAQLARMASADRLLAIEPQPMRRKVAQELGIRTIDPDDGDYISKIQTITGGGANVIFETSGHPVALKDAMKIAAYGAQISVVAGHYGIRELDMKTDFQNKELSLIGARRVDDEAESTLADRWTVARCAREFYEMIKSGKVSIEPLITHRMVPEQASEVYERLLKKDNSMLAVLFDWS